MEVYALSWRFMVLSWGLHGCMRFHRACVGFSWGFRGGCINSRVGTSRYVHEAFVVLSWRCVPFHALSLAVHGESRFLRVHFHGAFMGVSWRCMRFQGAWVSCHAGSTVIPWYFHGQSCGFRGAFMFVHGASMGLPCGGVYALPWDFHGGVYASMELSSWRGFHVSNKNLHETFHAVCTVLPWCFHIAFVEVYVL